MMLARFTRSNPPSRTSKTKEKKKRKGIEREGTKERRKNEKERMKFLLRAVDGSGVPFNADDRGNLENDTAAENGFTLKSHYSPELSPASL